jgi:hypothetical protein
MRAERQGVLFLKKKNQKNVYQSGFGAHQPLVMARAAKPSIFLQRAPG